MAKGMGYKIGWEGEAEFLKALREMTAQQKTLKTEMQLVTSEFDKNDKSQAKLTAQNKVLNKQIDLQLKKVLAQQEALQQAREAYDDNHVIVQKYTQDLNKAKAELNRLNRELEENEKAADGSGSGLEDFAGEMAGGMTKAGAFAAVLGGTLASKGLEVVAEAAVDATKAVAEFSADTERAVSKTRAQLGLTEEEAKTYAGIITEIYSDGFVDNTEEAAEALSKVKQQLKELPDEKLKNVSNQAIIMEKVFDVDVQEGLRGTDALMKQFGIDAEKAYDLMTVGAQKGLNQNGDLADQIAEYAVYYADAGYSAEQMFNMMISGAESGVYQIDYLNDAIKEFGIRTKDNSKSSAEAFAGLGLDAQKMFAMFAAGGEQAQIATQMVNNALFSMTDQVKQNEIGVALYGTKWEDLGISAVQAMATAQESIAGLDGATIAAGEAMTANFADQMQKLKQEVSAAVYEVANDIITHEKFEERMTDIMTRISDTISSNTPMILDKGFDMVEGFGEALADAAPELVPDIVQMIVQIASTLIEHIPDVAAVAPQIVGGLAIGIINAIPDLILAVPQLLGSFAKGFEDYDIEIIEIGVNIVKGILQGIKNAWSGLVDGFKGMLKNLVTQSEKELQIHSPSKVFRDKIGKQIVAGVEQGIEKNESKAVKAAREMSQNLLKAAEEYVSDKKFYNEMSLQDEAAFWEDLKTMSEFQADEIAEIDKKIYTAKEKAMEEEQKALEEYEKNIKSKAESISGFKGLFDAAESKDVSGKDLVANLESQMDAIEKYKTSLESLKEKGVSGGLFAELVGMGPEAADEIAALNTLTAAQLDAYIAMYEEKKMAAAEIAQQFYGVGTETTETLTDVGSGALSTSMEEQEVVVLEAAQKLAEAANEEIAKYETDFVDTGEQLMAGVAQGVRNGQSGVVNAIAAALRAAVRRARAEMKINSPSRVFAEIGEYMAAGLDVGWEDRMKTTSSHINSSLSNLSSPKAYASGGTTDNSKTYTYGDIVMNIDTVNNGNDRDTRRIAEELEFIRRQNESGKGGSA